MKYEIDKERISVHVDRWHEFLGVVLEDVEVGDDVFYVEADFFAYFDGDGYGDWEIARIDVYEDDSKAEAVEVTPAFYEAVSGAIENYLFNYWPEPEPYDISDQYDDWQYDC